MIATSHAATITWDSASAGYPDITVANNFAVKGDDTWFVNDGTELTRTGMGFVGVEGVDGVLNLRSNSGLPGTLNQNVYIRLGHFGPVGTLNIFDGVTLNFNERVSYAANVAVPCTINVTNGTLSYLNTTAIFEEGGSSLFAHTVGSAGEIIVPALISDATGFSAWMATMGNVTAVDISLTPAAGLTLVFTQDVGADTTTITAVPTIIEIISVSRTGSGDLEIQFSPGGAGFLLASSPDLLVDFAEEASATYDGTDTFTVPDAFIQANPDFFFRVEEMPPPLDLVDFESDDGGFTFRDHSGGTGSIWMHGAPNSVGGSGGEVTGGAGTPPSAQCWGTDIGDPGTYLVGTDTSLISPVIDLSGVPNAILSFAQAIDIDGAGSLVINVIDPDISGVINVLEPAVHTSTPDPLPSTAEWTTEGPIAITGGREVRIEWRFTGDGDGTGTGDGTFIGAYIDNVKVTAAP